ncbi:repressor LexA [Deferribacter autotrophicus]|uniref:Repressor LexA n=1 Tax=Deferribacter autotrophicus TaxID=500465 RepID=A0A5A8F0S1_9BACT|nr:transcriptional repressor LexA [Deferribacter autotrophicus]KAA0256917.1 repressor LexA [Deferribacter autotrophicus]
MLTDKQKKMLGYIKEFKDKNGYVPSVREICKGLNLSSTASVKKMLDRLEAKGVIRKNPQQARSIEIVDDFFDNKGLPVLGKVVAGYPVISEENVIEYIDLTRFNNKERFFFLKVFGDSMIEKKIFDGDYILVELTKELANGEIGVFRLNGEVTVKTYIKENGYFILRPENKAYEDIIVRDNDDFEIIGKVVYVMRTVI